MKFFQKVIMASEDVKSKLKTGRFYNASDAEAETFDGAAVVIGEPLAHDAYANTLDLNDKKLTYPTAATNRIGFVDWAGVAETDIYGNIFRVSGKQVGLPVPAGEYTRVRIPVVDDEFWLGAENFKTTPTIGKFAYPTAGEGALTVGNAQLASATNLKIIATKKLITGTVEDGTMYLCQVVTVA